MQPDLQIGQSMRPVDGIRRRFLPHHQAGARQHPVAMGRFDRGIDRGIEAEIISREYNLFQLAT
jgi:hypothetical protein